MTFSAPSIHLFIVTGLSGSGKSTVINALEDIGFFCIDNMPVVLLPTFVDLLHQSSWDINKVAIVMDVRERRFLSEFPDVFEELTEKGQPYHIIFLEATDDILIRRYKETRRSHPMAENPREGIARERKALGELKGQAHLIIDTSDFTPHQLRDRIFDYFKELVPKRKLRVTVMSFGYRHGTPSEADVMMDVRFLPNPFFVETLKKKTGMDGQVKKFVLGKQETSEFLQLFKNLLSYLIPRYVEEGRSYLTVALGCTGGIHRSVVLAGEVARWLGDSEDCIINVVHRDINKK
ncbi:MAG: RNase adapter RapZ [Deltaproteobacteria bacterium]|nr:RNase adapter RapZ [Candidatus Zymogenaceae bacterium]